MVKWGKNDDEHINFPGVVVDVAFVELGTQATDEALGITFFICEGGLPFGQSPSDLDTFFKI